MSSTVVALIVGVFSGVGTSIATYLITRKQSAAELEQTKAATTKLKAETDEIKLRLEEARSQAENVQQALNYAETTSEVRTIYDGSEGFDLFDFRPEAADGADARPTVRDGLLTVERMNTEGRFFLWLESYVSPDGKGTLMQRRSGGEGDRKLRVRCQVRAVDADHTMLLRVVAKDALPGQHLARWRERLHPSEWVEIDWYARFPAGEDSRFRIEDRNVSAVPSSLQIRNLIITEHA